MGEREPFNLQAELDCLNPSREVDRRQREPWPEDSAMFDREDYYDGDEPIWFDILDHEAERQRDADRWHGRG